MACNQSLTAIVQDCSASMGGIVEVYIANYDDISSVTVSDEQISAITPASTGATPFVKFAFRKETGSMTSTLNVDIANGVNYVSTEVALSFHKMETAKRSALAAMQYNELVAVVKDSNGKYWYLGYNEPAYVSAGTGETGTARGDANRYSATITDNSASYPYEVASGVIDALVAD